MSHLIALIVLLLPFIGSAELNCATELSAFPLDVIKASADKVIKGSRKGPKLLRDLAPDTDKIKLIYKGIPRTVVRLKREEVQNLVFRQYRSPETVQKILKEKRLQAGGTPYVFSHSEMQKETYVDLTGIFLTSTGFRDREVGVSYPSYVDVKINPDVPILIVEAGIYIIPGPPGISVPVEIINSKY